MIIDFQSLANSIILIEIKLSIQKFILINDIIYIFKIKIKKKKKKLKIYYFFIL